MSDHPTPWRVEYWQRFKEWHPKSGPHVVDANGVTVVAPHQFVGHPGEYDEQADDLANRIAAAVNGFES